MPAQPPPWRRASLVSQPPEHYHVPSTMKSRHSASLTLTHLAYNDNGRELAQMQTARIDYLPTKVNKQD